MDDILSPRVGVSVQRIITEETHHNSGNWPYILTKAFYIISAIYRQVKEFDQANEYIKKIPGGRHLFINARGGRRTF